MDVNHLKKSIELPIVDLTPWISEVNEAIDDDSTETDPSLKISQRLATVEKVKEACETVGFFVISIPMKWQRKSEQIISNAANSSRKFFQEDLVKRMECAAKKGDKTGAYGYFPMLSESLGYAADVNKKPDIREAFSMGPVVPLSDRLAKKLDEAQKRLQKDENDSDQLFCDVMNFCYEPTPWPNNSSLSQDNESSSNSLMESLSSFYQFASEIALITSKIMALALGFPENHFTIACSDGEHCNSARAIWYPKIRDEFDVTENQMRCGEHSDTGLLTLLWCDGPGLEIKPVGSEEWRAVNMREFNEVWTSKETSSSKTTPTNFFIVNIGDLLAKLSNGKWKSTPHRVPVPDKKDAIKNQDRIVLVLFQILAADFPIKNDLTQGEYLFSHFKRWGRNKT